MLSKAILKVRLIMIRRTHVGNFKARLLGRIKSFQSEQKGATAVEFAIVAVPFFAILLGILEVALIFVLNISLGVAAAALSTQMRTGQVQAPGVAATNSSGVQLDLADAKTVLCTQIPLIPLAICKQQLQIDVRPLTSFGNTASVSPISGSTFNSGNLCYYSGDAGSIVEMRVYYLFSINNPLLIPALSKITSYVTSGGSSSGNYFPITVTQVFKAEPFAGNSNTGAGC